MNRLGFIKRATLVAAVPVVAAVTQAESALAEPGKKVPTFHHRQVVTEDDLNALADAVRESLIRQRRRGYTDGWL